MKITLLPSDLTESAPPCQFLTTYLINDVVAIDAGSLGFYGGPKQQSAIQHVIITHSHIDHVASLPIFLEQCPRLATHAPHRLWNGSRVW